MIVIYAATLLVGEIDLNFMPSASLCEMLLRDTDTPRSIAAQSLSTAWKCCCSIPNMEDNNISNFAGSDLL